MKCLNWPLTVAALCLLGLLMGSSVLGQTSFFAGELIVPREDGAYLYQTKDTISGQRRYLPHGFTMLRVVDHSRDADFVYVKELDGEKAGYVLAIDVDKHPAPEFMMLHQYEDNPEVMKQIELNFSWHQYYNKAAYAAMRGDHAGFYYLMACNYLRHDSLQRAVVYFTKSIEIMPKRSAYLGRALSKSNLLDYAGAIVDCNKVIYMDANPVQQPNGGSYFRSMDFLVDMSTQPYGLRGFCYMKQRNLTAAVSDFNIATKKAPKTSDWYFYRGVCKYDMGQRSSACLDWSSAGELGEARAYEYIKEYCQ